MWAANTFNFRLSTWNDAFLDDQGEHELMFLVLFMWMYQAYHSVEVDLSSCTYKFRDINVSGNKEIDVPARLTINVGADFFL